MLNQCCGKKLFLLRTLKALKSQRQISDAIEWDVGETAGEYLESAACGLCARHYTKSLLKYVSSS